MQFQQTKISLKLRRSENREILSLRDRFAELQEQKKKFEKAAALFGCFVKMNAIEPVRDVQFLLLDFMIREEEAKSDKTESEKMVIEGLEVAKDAHIREMEAIEQSMKLAARQQQIKATDVLEKVEELCGMKHFGPMIEEVATVVGNAPRLQYYESLIDVRRK